MRKISRILIANRGEIALRIIRTCKVLGIESVLAVSEADKESLPAKIANRVVCIGPAQPTNSYLKVETILSAALGTSSDAIHPGYGFLSERPELAEGCAKHGLIFIGPKPENIKDMGNKLLARKMVRAFGVPTVPGSEQVDNVKQAIDVAKQIGFPLLLKAPQGGGGKGMKLVRNLDELKTAFETALAEVRFAFGDEALYIEHYLSNIRHIEVQILADNFGNVIHLGERDCSLQRRYQKIIEESPASSVPKDITEAICQAAVTIAKNAQYNSAGTVEFIFDKDNNKFYFLEMNTRIQVEHPVTEMVSGIDLVAEQIQVAADRPLNISQADVKLRGHAIECRINAEDPKKNFQPCPGRIMSWLPPLGQGIRVDTHCYSGYFVPPYYDSLLAKLITFGIDRSDTIERMQRALGGFLITGIETSVPFLNFLINSPDYVKGKVNTRWVEEMAGRFAVSQTV